MGSLDSKINRGSVAAWPVAGRPAGRSEIFCCCFCRGRGPGVFVVLVSVLVAPFSSNKFAFVAPRGLLDGLGSLLRMSVAKPFWRMAGLSFLGYSNICAMTLRNAVKEPLKTRLAAYNKLNLKIQKYSGGKADERGAYFLSCALVLASRLCQLAALQRNLCGCLI